MKFFSKKSNQESLKTLNEREIQQKLYGKYHAESSAKPTSNSVHSGTATLPRPEAKTRLERERDQFVKKQVGSQVEQIKKQIPNVKIPGF